jgi:putative transposase
VVVHSTILRAVPKRGCKPTIDLRDGLDALRYLAPTGDGMAHAAKQFSALANDQWRLVRRLLLGTIHDVALVLDRERETWEHSPTAGVVDSQSIKAAAAEKLSFDASRKVVGRRRHIAADTDGRLLIANLITADISDIEPVLRPSSHPRQALAVAEASLC